MIYVKKKVIVLKDEDVMEQNIITLGISHTSQSTPAKTEKKNIAEKFSKRKYEYHPVFQITVIRYLKNWMFQYLCSKSIYSSSTFAKKEEMPNFLYLKYTIFR